MEAQEKAGTVSAVSYLGALVTEPLKSCPMREQAAQTSSVWESALTFSCVFMQILFLVDSLGFWLPRGREKLLYYLKPKEYCGLKIRASLIVTFYYPLTPVSQHDSSLLLVPIQEQGAFLPHSLQQGHIQLLEIAS